LELIDNIAEGGVLLINVLTILSGDVREVPVDLDSDILTFYLPIFFTFKYVSSQNPANISKILKFWCVLSFCKVLQYFYSLILAQYSPPHPGTSTSSSTSSSRPSS
jgi:hypothetical protein